MPEQHPPITETTTGAASNGCPVVGHMKYPVEGGGNQDWWPNRLNLKVLHQNPAVADPMGAAFDYAAEVATIDVDALTRDIEEVMTTSQPLVARRLRPLRAAVYPDGVARCRHLPHPRRPRRRRGRHAAVRAA